MTHEDARLLLASYALGALDDDVEAIEKHIRQCSRCKAELADFLETTAKLGEAVDRVTPPAILRNAVLASVPVRHGPLEAITRFFGRGNWLPLTVATAILIAAVALAAVVVQFQQMQAVRSQLALDSRGLDLLTSTEVIAQRLAPVFDPASQAHGHWYHRPGVGTQVIVVEFLPAAARGQAYYAWLQRADGSWTSPGALSLDANGYGRLIIVDGDGTDVRSVEVTRQTEPSPAPAGVTILRWSSG